METRKRDVQGQPEPNLPKLEMKRAPGGYTRKLTSRNRLAWPSAAIADAPLMKMQPPGISLFVPRTHAVNNSKEEARQEIEAKINKTVSTSCKYVVGF